MIDPTNLTIRDARSDDLPVLLDIHRAAFGQDMEADLTAALLEDPTAAPWLSLVAEEPASPDSGPLGHILFTAIAINDSPAPLRGAVLAPVGVRPDAQRRGIGGALIRAGLERLAGEGVDVVVLAGYPEYYPRFGFRPAFALGLEPPMAFPPEHADAWMVALLRPDLAPETVRGRVTWAETFSRPEFQDGPPEE